MAIGLEKCWALTLLKTLTTHIISKSITEFWRRWAYIFKHMVSGICVHSSGRQPGKHSQAYPQYYGRVAAYRILARGCMELYAVGDLLRRPAFAGKVHTEGFSGPHAVCRTAYLCHGLCDHRMGIFLFTFSFLSHGVSGTYVWHRYRRIF